MILNGCLMNFSLRKVTRLGSNREAKILTGLRDDKVKTAAVWPMTVQTCRKMPDLVDLGEMFRHKPRHTLLGEQPIQLYAAAQQALHCTHSIHVPHQVRKNQASMGHNSAALSHIARHSRQQMPQLESREPHSADPCTLHQSARRD